MCTLAVAFDPSVAWPLVVAANRDEALDRPSLPPMWWPGAPGFTAPRDERAGGTWIGISDRGLFVGITNRFGSFPDPARQSRGMLVVDALRSPSAAALHAHACALDPRRYNPFHLLYADARSAFITWGDGQELHQVTLSPGLHVVTERSFGGDDARRVAKVNEGWPPAPDPQALHQLMATHGAEPGASLCLHLPGLNYGTRSSAVARVGRTTAELWWTEGSPCTAPQVEVPLPELRR